MSERRIVLEQREQRTRLVATNAAAERVVLIRREERRRIVEAGNVGRRVGW